MGDLEAARETAAFWASLAKIAAEPGRGRNAAMGEFFYQATDSGFRLHSARDVIERSKAGDQDARKALHYAIAWCFENGDLSEELKHYNIEQLLSDVPPKRKQGGNPHENYLRDGCIKIAVAAVRRHGFLPTRNEATEEQSACSIVADALAAVGLGLKEKNVARISGPFVPDKPECSSGTT